MPTVAVEAGGAAPPAGLPKTLSLSQSNYKTILMLTLAWDAHADGRGRGWRAGGPPAGWRQGSGWPTRRRRLPPAPLLPQRRTPRPRPSPPLRCRGRAPGLPAQGWLAVSQMRTANMKRGSGAFWIQHTYLEKLGMGRESLMSAIQSTQCKFEVAGLCDQCNAGK